MVSEEDARQRLSAACAEGLRLRADVQRPLLLASLAALALAVPLFLASMWINHASASLALGLLANVFGVGAAWLGACAVLSQDRRLPYLIALVTGVSLLLPAAVHAYFAHRGLSLHAVTCDAAAARSECVVLATVGAHFATTAAVELACSACCLLLASRRLRPAAARRLLERLLRAFGLLFAPITELPFAIVLLAAAGGGPSGTLSLGLFLALRAVLEFVLHAAIVLALSPARVQGALARRSGAALGSAALAALLGELSAQEAHELGTRTLRGVSLAHLEQHHLDHPRPAEDEAGEARSSHSPPPDSHEVGFGGADGFVSHSDGDDAGARWAALQAWRGAFHARHGREPVVCLGSARSAEPDTRPPAAARVRPSLARTRPPAAAQLPTQVAGSGRLLVLLGPSWAEQVHCVVELLVALEMGVGPADIDVLELPGGAEALERLSARAATASAERSARGTSLGAALGIAALDGGADELSARLRAALGEARGPLKEGMSAPPRLVPTASSTSSSCSAKPQHGAISPAARSAAADADGGGALPPAPVCAAGLLAAPDEEGRGGGSGSGSARGARDPRISNLDDMFAEASAAASAAERPGGAGGAAAAPQRLALTAAMLAAPEDARATGGSAGSGGGSARGARDPRISNLDDMFAEASADASTAPRGSGGGATTCAARFRLAAAASATVAPISTAEEADGEAAPTVTVQASSPV